MQIDMWTNPGAPNGEWSWCSKAGNHSGVSFNGHLEFFIDGSHYANGQEFNVAPGNYTPETCFNIPYPGFYDLGVTLWKDSGNNHSALVHVQDY